MAGDSNDVKRFSQYLQPLIADSYTIIGPAASDDSLFSKQQNNLQQLVWFISGLGLLLVCMMLNSAIGRFCNGIKLLKDSCLPLFQWSKISTLVDFFNIVIINTSAFLGAIASVFVFKHVTSGDFLFGGLSSIDLF